MEVEEQGALLVRQINDIRNTQVSKTAVALSTLWLHLMTDATAWCCENPDAIPSILALGATHFNMTPHESMRMGKLKKGERHKDEDKIVKFKAAFSLEGGSEDHQADICDILEKMKVRISDLAFISTYKNKRVKSAPVLCTFGFLMPGSHAYPTGAWLPFLAGPYNEVAKNSQGTKYPSLQELRENSDARLLVIRQETMRSFRSMRAQWMTSISVILQEESVLKASTTVTPPPPPENGEDDDRDEEDDDRDEEDDDRDEENDDLDGDNSSSTAAPAKKVPMELQPTFCRRVISRVTTNTVLARANSEAAQTQADFMDFAMNVKEAMQHSAYTSNLSAMTLAVCAELDNTTGGGDHLSLLTGAGSATRAAASETKTNDLAVDMSNDENGLCEATGYRLGALAVVQAAIDDTMTFKKLTGMKRCMAVSNHSLRKKVCLMSADLTSSDIVKNYFVNEDKVKDLTGDLEAANSEIEELKWFKAQHEEREERDLNEFIGKIMFSPGLTGIPSADPNCFHPDDNGVTN